MSTPHAGEVTATYKAYGDMFDNLGDLTHPSLDGRPDFVQMLREAVITGKPVTRQDIEAVFGDPGWEW